MASRQFLDAASAGDLPVCPRRRVGGSRARLWASSCFLDVEGLPASRESAASIGAAPALPPPLRRRQRRGIAVAASFEDVESCYSRAGQLCNADALKVEPAVQKKMDRQSAALEYYYNHGACSDSDQLTAEDCRENGGIWHEMPGPTLTQRLSSASALASTSLARVQSAAASYQKAHEALDNVFPGLEHERTVWQKVMNELQDAYSLWCRPFHDVSMECESKFRQAVRWWSGREPLPACEVGVVTPYAGKPSKGSRWPLGFLDLDLGASPSYSDLGGGFHLGS
eukprot:TRINITY_DN28216_c0_g1_i1.p1 TRINITY_DN28216_c0_g1~~TRINITY_DN28216_c0_g1_i1.p1  ORF type:complete len:321 (-),score=49.05 TRINITY_DN28216_c0_g1_i1:86-934(-)